MGTRNGVAVFTYIVDDVEINECPVSAITPESQQLIQLFAMAGHAHEASGATLFGPDLSKWPARMFDAQVVLEQCRIEENNARCQAEADMRDRD